MPTAYPGSNDSFGVPSSPATTPLASAGDSTRSHTQSHQDLGDAIIALQKNAAQLTHDHSGTAGDPRATPKLKGANTHEAPDTDADVTSLHHTLGTNHAQAAAGDHTHDITAITSYNDNSKLERRLNVHRQFKGGGVYASGSLSTTAYTVVDYYEFTPSQACQIFMTCGLFGYCSFAGAAPAATAGQWLLRFTLESASNYGTYLYDAQKLWTLTCSVATNNVRLRSYALCDVSAMPVLAKGQKYRVAVWAMQDPNATAPLLVDQVSWHVFESFIYLGT